MGLIGCPETSVRNYQYSPHNNQEECSSQNKYLFGICAYFYTSTRVNFVTGYAGLGLCNLLYCGCHYGIIIILMYFFLRKVGYHVTDLTLRCLTMAVGVGWCDAQRTAGRLRLLLRICQ
jgi:hypothetical protein